MISPFHWQRPAIDQLERALLTHGAAINASDTGTGKTVMALDICRRHNWRPAVLCPKVAIEGWRRTCKAMGLEPFFIDTYEKAIMGNTAWVSRIGGKMKTHPITGKKKRERVAFRWHLPEDTLTIFDEVHKCKDYKKLFCALHVAHSAQGIASLNLSATVADNPLDMKAVGVALKLFEPREFIEWALVNGATPKYWGGYEFKDRMAEQHIPIIHSRIFPERGARIRIKDVPSFPETQIIAECHDVMSKSLPKDLDALVKEYSSRAEAVLTDGKTKLEFTLRMRQATEAAKLQTLLDLHREYRENGMSVIIFVSYDHSLKWLRDNIEGAITIHGTQSEEERAAQIERFQSNASRTCIANIAAGGVGVDLDDRDGRFPRVSLICPTYNARELKQALGRPHRATSKSKSLQRIIYAAGTIEEDICEAVSGKLDRLDLLNDGVILNAIFKGNT